MITKTFDSRVVNTDTPLISRLQESTTSDPKWLYLLTTSEKREE